MKLKYYFLLTFFLALTSYTTAQKIQVVDESTGKGINGVFLMGKTQSVLTDEQGWVDVSILKEDEQIIFQHPNYQNRVLSYAQIIEDKTISLRESSVKLEEVVISINRWEQNRRQVPVKYLSLQLPQNAPWTNPQTTADLLGQSGEVFIQKSQLGGGSPMIRGFSANRLLMVVDGVRMNNAIFRGGNVQNVISLDANNLEEAEVIFGPGSVIYGSDALGGVMDFHTLQPRFAEEEPFLVKVNALTRYASANNEKTGSLSLRLGTKKWAYAGSFSYSDFEDLRMGTNGGQESYLRDFYVERIGDQDQVIENPTPTLQIGSAYSQWNLLQKIRFKPTPQWDFSYSFLYTTTSDIPRYDRLIELREGTPRSAEWYYGPQEWQMHSLHVLHRPKDNPLFKQARLTLAQQLYRESRNTRRFGSDQLRTQTERVDAPSINLDFDKPFNDRHSLFYGAEWVFNRVGSTAQSTNIINEARTPAATRYPDGATWRSQAVYASYQGTWNEQLTTTAGLRFSQVLVAATFDRTFYPFPFERASTNNSAINGSAGLVYRPTESWQINLQGSTGFRAPNVDDIGKLFDSAPGILIVPNPSLRSEYVWNVETGVIKNFGNDLQIEGSAFHAWLEDAIVRRNASLNGQDSVLYDGQLSQVQALQNVSAAQIWGLQGAIRWDISNRWRLHSTLTYTQGETNEGEAVRHVAPLFGQTSLTFRTEKFLVELSAVYNGEISFANLAPSERDKPQIYAQDAQGNPYAPAWTILNAKTNYRLGENLQISAGVENILDKQYRPYSSGIVAPGRNFIVSLRGSF